MIWLIIIVGAILRISLYLSSQIFIWDEAALAMNIIKKPFFGLVTLDHVQHAPLFFLWLQKLTSIVLPPYSELTFRLWPLIFGIGSLYLFYLLASQLLDQKISRFLTACMAISGSLITFSAMNKQYSGDIFFCLILYLAYFKYRTRPIYFGLIGAIVVWFSHPAIFILVSMGLVLLLSRTSVKNILLIGGIWMTSIVANYWLVLRLVPKTDQVFADFASDFLRLPGSFFDLHSYLLILITLSQFFLGPLAVIGLSFTLIGGWSLWKTHKSLLAILIIPGLFGVIASLVHYYPIAPRLWFFINPPMYILIGFGWKTLAKKYLRLSIVLAVLMLISLAWTDTPAQLTAQFYEQQGIKQVLTSLRRRYRPGDTIYAYYSTDEMFAYYAPRYFRSVPPFISGTYRTSDLTKYQADLDRLAGKSRVWIVLTHDYNWNGIDEEKFMTDYLDKLGKREDFIHIREASLYLYDLSH